MKDYKSDIDYPVIVSASRATDIPAFYSEWFFNRLKQGWVNWKNPFNGKISKISFEKTRLIVFWSKNPSPLIDKLGLLDGNYHINYYIQNTLNDYSADIEPSIPNLSKRIDTFKKLSELSGKHIIWRFDPILVSNQISVDLILDKIDNLANKLNGYTDRLVISFIDVGVYKHLKCNSTLNDLGVRELRDVEIDQIGIGLMKISEQYKINVVSCSEARDLSQYNIRKGSCIDPYYIIDNFKDDDELMSYLGFNKAQISFLDDTPDFKKLKDKGQRKYCGCIKSKDIGAYNSCKHLCIYCYANHKKNIIDTNYNKNQADSSSDLLIPDE